MTTDVSRVKRQNKFTREVSRKQINIFPASFEEIPFFGGFVRLVKMF